jgi:hypothetical protein
MNEIVTRIHAIYDRLTPAIHPYIGAAFREPNDGQLRIMAVGINAYSGVNTQGKESPGWFAGWFTSQKYRFYKGVWRDLQGFAKVITRPPFLFAGREFAGMESVYLTNAVKVYVKESEGKRADQLTPDHFAAHLGQWRDELDALAESDAHPHVVAIIGDPFWSYACDSFRRPAFKSLQVTKQRWCDGKSLHFANRYVVAGPHGERELLLVRLRHPAGRSRTGSPRWLFEQPDFREVAS